MAKKSRKYVFFYHYFKQKKMMSVHFKNTCHVTMNVVCMVPCQTKWSKRQPYIVMKGLCSEIVIEEETITIK